MARGGRSSTPAQAVNSAISGIGGFRADPQTEMEAQGDSNEGLRLIANMGPVFDSMWGRAPNPGGRADLPEKAFVGSRPFHGVGDQTPADDPAWWNQGATSPSLQRIPQSIRPQQQLNQAVRGISG